MDSTEYHLSKFENNIANQFWHNVFYNNVLIRVFYYLLEKRINTRILFLMTTYRRVLAQTSACSFFNVTYSNQLLSPLSALTVFLSIPQITEKPAFTFNCILLTLSSFPRTETSELDSAW